MSIEDYALELGVDTKTVISKLKELGFKYINKIFKICVRYFRCQGKRGAGRVFGSQVNDSAGKMRLDALLLRQH